MDAEQTRVLDRVVLALSSQMTRTPACIAESEAPAVMALAHPPSVGTTALEMVLSTERAALKTVHELLMSSQSTRQTLLAEESIFHRVELGQHGCGPLGLWGLYVGVLSLCLTASWCCRAGRYLNRWFLKKRQVLLTLLREQLTCSRGRFSLIIILGFGVAFGVACISPFFSTISEYFRFEWRGCHGSG